MSGKSATTRWSDTINYLNQNFNNLGQHINGVVAAGKKRENISKELSLGSRSDGKDDPQYQTATDQRIALRALLLCQRVYFGSDTWCKSSTDDNDGLSIPYSGCLPVDWKRTSLTYWGQKSQAAINEGIKMFLNSSAATKDDLQTVAFDGQWFSSEPEYLLKMSRTDAVEKEKTITTCYMGIQGWLLLSKVVSLRWVMKNVIPTKKNGCNHLFGVGNEVWRAKLTDSDIPKVRQIISAIDKGSIVHIWSPDNYNWNGHWVITNGDDTNNDGGTICGVNNGEIKADIAERGKLVKKPFTNHSTLFEQFWCYGGEGDSKGKKTAVMEVIDPLNMGNGIRI